ncbi:MAG: NAD-dependent epimerase/dehydratase family protein [Deltaproteobacteria bacterium]|nr:NAD-dependent epimerase/dehydratase family protein [Deltaproteobacteria bacterium]
MRALVTGGGGFLGSAIAGALLERGHAVRILARGDYPAMRALGAETVRADLCDANAVMAACAGVDVVFHVAARVGFHGPAGDYESVNVGGTQNVIAACQAHGIGRLVFTSTPSVVHSREGSEGVDESAPYPTEWVADYPRTKALAEQKVIAADSPELRTVSLRPRGIWGPGDTQLMPKLVRWAKAGQLKRIGTEDPLQSFSYIDNVVHAHLCAEESLRSPASSVGGKAYFVSDGEPVGSWTMADLVLQAAGLRLPDKFISVGKAARAATVIEWIWNTFGLSSEPRITRYKLDVLTKPCWFDISAARRDLGYEPPMTREAGLAKLKEWVDAGGLESSAP